VSGTGCNTTVTLEVGQDTVGSPEHMGTYLACSTDSKVITLPAP
jgi:hypothetical protein